jgi:flagellin
MVQTAEGALTEMNTMLNSIRGLAVHAANTAANDSSSIAADQTAVDKAVDSIQRIATTTKFAGKFLLNGGATNAEYSTLIGSGSTGTTGITVGTMALDKDAVASLLGTATTGNVSIVVTTAAAVATTSGTASVAGGIVSLAGGATFKVENAAGGSITVNLLATTSMGMASFAKIINDASLGITATVGASGGTLQLTTSGLGADKLIKITTAGSAAGALVTAIGVGSADATSGNATAVSIFGTNIAGQLKFGDNVVSMVGGSAGALTFTSTQTGWTGLSLTLTSERNSTTAAQGAFQLDKNGEELKFSLTPDASTADIINYGIANMQTSKLGLGAIAADTTNYAGLNAIIAGGTYNLSTDAESAVSIIEQAISDVSSERSQLGSFQKFTLETTVNNLGVTKENLTASESRIRDVDMAAEMMNFMKNQILVQAGTAMLAQANQLPTTVLQLLK